MEYAIVLLIIAAFMLITGIVGHDTQAGSHGITIGIKGKVGPIPRVVLVVASGVTFVMSVVFFIAVQPTPDPQPNPDPIIVTTTAKDSDPVDYSLVVGIRPAAGQVAEKMKLSMDEQRVASWTADQESPTHTFALRALPGTHTYKLTGSFSYLDAAGNVMEQAVAGEGVVNIEAGTALNIYWVGGNEFQLRPMN